ncbi:ATP-binding protein [Paenibacillus kyungheensis]|uniref:ATP-binding protein n=1 Tax=Paenibacillus kyungheensis TaxID=1452732 RepID=A0AAX3M3S3_9BACL|nr:ATP-binding protein [Paenibacillus kyungheensis]WCT56770.1 ATP-binding protein [Paenibacillus kyungheensis]
MRKDIDASPSKDFFITMLTRDIPVVSAITELVDNSIDGATKLLRETNSENYEGYQIDLLFDKDQFSIKDNCGGISVKTAKEYAFRFGRPEQYTDNEIQSIGRFGVGMKRALFRLGDFFQIHSISRESSFNFSVDVKEWRKDPEWKFSFKETNININNPLEITGTEVIVKSLHNEEQFDLPSFEKQLIEEIKSKVGRKLDKGLKININGAKIKNDIFEIIDNEIIKPAYFEKVYQNVNIKIIVGLGKREPSRSGWYIFCNDRLILAADKSFITGWGDNHSLYHNDVAWFRGYVFFESTDALLLPWTTTKTGIDVENDAFRFARTQMMIMMKSLTKYLRDVASQSEDGNDSIKEFINSSSAIKIEQVNFNILNISPKLPSLNKNTPKERRISYLMSIDKIEKAQELTGISTLKDIGAYTFNYYLEMDGEE